MEIVFDAGDYQIDVPKGRADWKHRIAGESDKTFEGIDFLRGSFTILKAAGSDSQAFKYTDTGSGSEAFREARGRFEMASADQNYKSGAFDPVKHLDYLSPNGDLRRNESEQKYDLWRDYPVAKLWLVWKPWDPEAEDPWAVAVGPKAKSFVTVTFGEGLHEERAAGKFEPFIDNTDPPSTRGNELEDRFDAMPREELRRKEQEIGDHERAQKRLGPGWH